MFRESDIVLERQINGTVKSNYFKFTEKVAEARNNQPFFLMAALLTIYLRPCLFHFE